MRETNWRIRHEANTSGAPIIIILQQTNEKGLL